MKSDDNEMDFDDDGEWKIWLFEYYADSTCVTLGSCRPNHKTLHSNDDY